MLPARLTNTLLEVLLKPFLSVIPHLLKAVTHTVGCVMCCVVLCRRNKQTMGLGSLFGESDLQQLDGDAVRERQVVDRQVLALWEIL